MNASTTALDARFGFLDGLPPALLSAAIELSAGTLEERVHCLLAWRGSLLAGRLPSVDAASWQSRPLVDSALEELGNLEIPRYCSGIPDLVDAVLLSVLESWNHAEANVQALRAAELRNLQRKLAEIAAKRRASHGLEEKLRLEIEGNLARLAAMGVRDELASAWTERVAIWAELETTFGGLSTLLGLGWDLSRGILRSVGWKQLENLRQLLASLPELREIVRTLGRMQASDDDSAQPIVEQILEPLRRSREIWLDARLPDIPHDTRGLVRSGSIERMIPAEAALLSHPKLRLLWHLRRAERSLLGYRVEGVQAERLAVEDELETGRRIERPPMVRGPILVCLDTSGSMAGLPEHVAKALVLEAMRTAHVEQRACYLYAFSGSGEVREMELSLNERGLASLLDFLGTSFHGGTDVSGPVRRAIAKLDDDTWQRADILLVTDGEFPTDEALEREIVEARTKRGVRIHGILVGSQGSAAMTRLCEPLHRFNDWNALGRLE